MADLHHGGRLREAAAHYDIPLAEWLDLSTGINPVGWPVPSLPAECWQRLPEVDDGLEQAAAAYYGTKQLLPVAGSQAAIQALPGLRPRCRVGILAPSYAEHAVAWQARGHEVVAVGANAIETVLSRLDVLLLVNPNNPTGERFDSARLLDWHRQLADRGGWLVVDEAFMDTTPQQSLAGHTGEVGLIVLRSLGKFFGLAGVRVGFVLAWSGLLEPLSERLGPWAISGPSREVARLALSDRRWQAESCQRLLREGERLHALLLQHGLPPAAGPALFQYCPTEAAAALHEALAEEGILTRLFSQPAAVRFGLPGNEADWLRLEQALSTVLSHPTRKRALC